MSLRQFGRVVKHLHTHGVGDAGMLELSAHPFPLPPRDRLWWTRMGACASAAVVAPLPIAALPPPSGIVRHPPLLHALMLRGGDAAQSACVQTPPTPALLPVAAEPSSPLAPSEMSTVMPGGIDHEHPSSSQRRSAMRVWGDELDANSAHPVRAVGDQTAAAPSLRINRPPSTSSPRPTAVRLAASLSLAPTGATITGVLGSGGITLRRASRSPAATPARLLDALVGSAVVTNSSLRVRAPATPATPVTTPAAAITPTVAVAAAVGEAGAGASARAQAASRHGTLITGLAQLPLFSGDAGTDASAALAWTAASNPSAVPGAGSYVLLPASAPSAGAVRHVSWRGIVASGVHLPARTASHHYGDGLIAGADSQAPQRTLRCLGELEVLHGSASQWRLRLPKSAHVSYSVEMVVGQSDADVLRRLGARLPGNAPLPAGVVLASSVPVPQARAPSLLTDGSCPTVPDVVASPSPASQESSDVIAIVSAMDGSSLGPVVGVWSGMYAMHANASPTTDPDAAGVMPSLSATRVGLDAAIAWSPLCVPTNTPARQCKLQLAAVGLHCVTHERFVGTLAALAPSSFRAVVQVYKSQVEALAEWCAWPLPHAVTGRLDGILELSFDWPLGVGGTTRWG